MTAIVSILLGRAANADAQCAPLPDTDGDGIGDSCDPCVAGASVLDGRLVIRRLDTPPGDDRLGWRGVVQLPYPFVPSLDPPNRGVRIVVSDGTGAVITDSVIPPGGYDPITRRGWTISTNGTTYTYKQVGNLVPLIGGIRKVVVRDNSTRSPGRVKFAVTGNGGAFPVSSLPVRGTLIFDPPAAPSGQCADHAFPGPPPVPSCSSPVSDQVVCR